MKHPKRFHVGQHNIRTAIAATLCAVLYLLAGRNPTFACIGAIFGTGSDMEGSLKHGGNRFFGTLIGGLLGMGLFRLYMVIYPDGKTRFLILPFLFAGVVILVLVSRIFWRGAVQPGGVILCILLFNTPPETYLSYSIARIIDTGIGVAVALLVSLALPRQRVDRWLAALKRKRTE